MKTDFNNKLDLLTRKTPANEEFVLLRDYNAIVSVDLYAWADFLGKPGIERSLTMDSYSSY